jgi:asparagine synthase (glutamine-hydrolysing)
MAVSLEVRVPLLDHRLFAHTWRLPMHMKVRDGVGKWVLRKILHKYVPAELVERPKMGFGVPIDVWLRGPLRDWAEELLRADTLRREGLVDADLVRSIWAKHLAGENYCYSLWSVLMFEAWRNYWFTSGCAAQKIPETPFTISWA